MNKDKSDSGLFLLVFCLIVILIGFFYYFFSTELKTILINIKMLWIKPAKYIFGNHIESLNNVYDLLTIYTPKEISVLKLNSIFYRVGWLFYPILIIVYCLFSYIVIKNILCVDKYHTRKSLNETQSIIWPWILPVMNLDLIKEPMKSGSWSIALNPLDFCKKYDLFLDVGNNNANKMAENNVLLKRDKAKKLFISQLGSLWSGIDNLPLYAQGLLMCFIAQANNDKDLAKEGLETMSRSISKLKPDYSFLKKMKNKYLGTSIYNEITSKNCYNYNVICTALREARGKGILPPSYFLWLKPIDRVLWYSLNCQGRKTPFCEVAGIFCHGLAEEVVGKKIQIPYIDNAVNGLEDELKTIDLSFIK